MWSDILNRNCRWFAFARWRGKASSRNSHTSDFLVVLDRGHVIETGTYAELVARNGLYVRLIRRQLGSREAVAAVGE